MFAMFPDSVEEKYNIRSIGIIDRYLEHSRIFYFYNGGKENIYISSADLMSRNLDRRVEVTVPIYDPEIKKELSGFLDLQWHDNTAARILDNGLTNQINGHVNDPKLTAQLAFYDFLQSTRMANQ
jgi:polyphosphate kinase